MNFTKDSIKIDPAKEVEKITSKLREDVAKKLKKRGVKIRIAAPITTY